ncbi:MAG: hypothetical protein OET44_17655 [Gammaproteobacteria bacterium]|nr:hypothetical protein [Gammaproteobacteria bacterium]
MRAKRLAIAVLASAVVVAVSGAYAAENRQRHAYSVSGGAVTNVPSQTIEQPHPAAIAYRVIPSLSPEPLRLRHKRKGKRKRRH